MSEQTVRLYRGEPDPAYSKTNVPRSWQIDPNYINSQKAKGRWFTPHLQSAQWYVEELGLPHRPAHIVYIDIPADEAEKYRVSNLAMNEGNTPDNPRAFSLNPEQEFYLPRALADTKQSLA